MTSPGQNTNWLASEYFAGIGLAKLGMSQAGIDVVWSNDIEPLKHAMFKGNFGVEASHAYVVADLGRLTRDELPPRTDIAWASFPCTDLSLAGGRAGLHKGAASSTFWHFIKALSKMGDERPTIIALENVTGFATSHGGRDITSAIRSLNGLGYSIDILSIDARRFVPQSRPRLFLIGVRGSVQNSNDAHPLRPNWLQHIFEDQTLRTHKLHVPLPPEMLTSGLSSYLDQIDPEDDRWWNDDRRGAFENSLSELQHDRFEVLRRGSAVTSRTAYRRMRQGVARWELRPDDIAGCLRTSSGGSSKQAVVQLGNGAARIRWMTPREYSKLMGAPEYMIDDVKPHRVFSGFGDAVCAQVVAWLSTNYFVPFLSKTQTIPAGHLADLVDLTVAVDLAS